MQIKGKYERKIFRSEDTGFTVGIIKVTESSEKIEEKLTFTGYFPDIIEGELYNMTGEIVEHNKYGLQLSVKQYEKEKLESSEKLIQYLSSDMFPGIGKRIAKKLVDHYGMEVLEKIIEDKNNLLFLKIPQTKIDTLYDNIIKYEVSHNIILFLTDLGFNTKEALKIYNSYGVNTPLYLESNIYALIDDVDDISFLKIDKLREKFNITKTDTSRILAGIIYSMKNFTFQTGDTYLRNYQIKSISEETLDIEINDIDEYLNELEVEGKIIIEEEKYYLFEYYDAESYITEFIHNSLKLKKYKYSNFNILIENIESEANIKYNGDQLTAIKMGIENNFSIITGGPGVGKTTIIKAIVEIYRKDIYQNFILLAPTGRASKRLSESTNTTAMTIHRFLKWNKETDEFMMNENNKSDVKLVIIDEASMVDVILFSNLLKALKPNTRVIVVGDYFQLPSVSPGQVLKDLIESEIIPSCKLELLYRQKETSTIPYLADNIKKGNTDEVFYESDDYEFITNEPSNIIESVISVVKQLIKEGNSYFDFQVMAPIYKGPNGIDMLNKVLQDVCNPKTAKFELKYFDRIYRIGDKVIQLTNVFDESIFNGDIGIIKDVISGNISDSGKDEIHVEYDGLLVRYLPSDFNMIKHAYAISIHKSQGSEFKTVVIPICPSYRRMLYRKLIYTGITRAKTKLYLIGVKDGLLYSIKNNSESLRNSGLKTRLIEFDN